MLRPNIIILAGILISSSCPSFAQVKEPGIDSVKQTIIVLRKHGFFEKYSTLSNDQVFDTLHQQRIAEFSKMFERYYDPGMELETFQILMLDRKKVVYGDGEAGVGKGNNAYVSLLQAFSAASGGLFNPKNIIEKWETGEGPIQVSFINQDEKIMFEPDYTNDWLSEKVFEVINQQMIKNGKEKFYLFLEKDGLGLGQYFLYIRMTELQKKGLEKTFGWKFSD